MPSGGLMRAASTKSTIMTPNQTKSTSAALRVGSSMGTVVTIIAKLSMKVPSIR